jgi:hypothetical protein
MFQRIVIPSCLGSSSSTFEVHDLEMETLQCFETSGPTHQMTQCHIPEDSNLQQHCCKNVICSLKGIP